MSNVVLLAGILTFVLQASGSNASAKPISLSATTSSTAVNPVDQLSSANIALTVSRLAQLPETRAINNTADSQVTQLTMAPTNDNVVAKPQVINTALKSKADIKDYITQAGDTITSIADKFGVTSNSIRWSNGLTGDSISAGTNIAIPPVNGIVYTVKAGDTLDSLAQKYSANKDQLIAYNDAEIDGLQAGERILIPNGQITAPAIYTASVSFGWGATPVAGFNGYDFGYCTWYVANRRADLGHAVPANLGNASTWAIRAISFGMPVGKTPQVGAVVVDPPQDHVMVVEQINDDGSYWVSEMNDFGQVSMTDSRPAGGWDRIDYRLISAASASRYDYIY